MNSYNGNYLKWSYLFTYLLTLFSHWERKFLNHRAVFCQFTAVSQCLGRGRDSTNYSSHEQNEGDGNVTWSNKSPLRDTQQSRHRNCCRIPEAWTCVWFKEQNKMSEDRLVGCAGPPDWICDVAVKLGLTLPFWGMLEGPWKKPAWQWLSQQNKEGSYFLEDFRTSVS